MNTGAYSKQSTYKNHVQVTYISFVMFSHTQF